MHEKEPRRVKRVVKKPVQQENLIVDSLRETWAHMLTNVLIPGIRDSLYEGGVGVLNTLIYQDDQPQARGAAVGRGKAVHRKNYNKMHRQGPRFSERDQRNMRFEKFTFDSHKEAKGVLDDMMSALSQYGVATVSDFYEAAGYSNTNFTNDNWGWVSLTGSRIKATGHGFVVILPDPEPLN